MPSMSYCMCENTALELRQIVSTISDDFDGSIAKFKESLSRDEKRGFAEILRLVTLLVEGEENEEFEISPYDY